MKNINKLFVMVLVLVALMVLAPACKTADIDEVENDIVFVSLDITKTDYPGYATVDITPHVKAISTTMTAVSAAIYVNGVKDDAGRSQQLMPGDWQDFYLSGRGFYLESGTYEIRADCTLQSTGKTVTKTTTIVVP